MSEEKAITFQAQVFKVATLIDGGIRLTLDLSDSKTSTIMSLINARQPGIMLEVAAVAIDVEAEEKNKNGRKIHI